MNLADSRCASVLNWHPLVNADTVGHMDARTKATYSPALLEGALARYGIDAATVEELGGFESFVYRCRHENKPRILRISHSLRRNSAEISAEIDWVNYLASAGLSVCPAVRSRSGAPFEVLGGADDYFTAALFEQAPGKPPAPDDWTPGLLREIGRMMGRMHALAKTYQPPEGIGRRPHWHQETDGFAEQYLPPGQETVIEKFAETATEARALPADEHAYGLVHLDFHGGNFFVDDKEVQLFDFDDCQYSWFADDIAVAMFNRLPHDGQSPEARAAAQDFMRHFLDGYRPENDLADGWLEQIPLFLKRREIDIYVLIHRSFDLSKLSPNSASFMDGRRERIENGVPFVDFDFARC